MKRQLFFLIASWSCLHATENHEITLIASRPGTTETTFLYASYNITLEPTHPTTWGIRYAYEVINLGPTQLQLQFTYHAPSSADVQIKTPVVSTFRPFPTLKNHGFSTGFLAKWRLGVDFGIGAQFRYEDLSWGNTNTSQIRPWLISRVSYSVPFLVLKPVFGIEYNVALTHKSQPSAAADPYFGLGYSNLADTAKCLSPTNEISLFAGIRF